MHRTFLVRSLVATATLVVIGNANADNLPFGLYGTVANNEAETVALIEKVEATGIDVLHPSLSGGGGVIWKTEREVYYPPLADTVAQGWDPLESFIRHAHAKGIRVYPSIAIGPMTKLIEQHPEWETRDRKGRPSSVTTARSFSFAYPEARAAKIATIMDLINGYAVDGVMLDYCRYPETTHSEETKYGFYGYDEPLIEACRALHGFDPREVPIDSPQWQTFNQMRIDTIMAFVREMRQAIEASGREVRLGGFGDTDPAHEARMCGRDWPLWANERAIDDVFLATYTETLEEMPAVVERASQLIPSEVQLHSALTPFQGFLKTEAEMVAAAKAQRSAGADGLWIYREDFLDSLDLWAGAKQVSRMMRP